MKPHLCSWQQQIKYVCFRLLFSFINTPRDCCMFLLCSSTYDKCASVGVELCQPPPPPLRFINSLFHLVASIYPQVCQEWMKIRVMVTLTLLSGAEPFFTVMSLTLNGKAHIIWPGGGSSTTLTAFAD